MECFTAVFSPYSSTNVTICLLGGQLGTYYQIQAYQGFSWNFLISYNRESLQLFGSSYTYCLVIMMQFCFTCVEKTLLKPEKSANNLSKIVESIVQCTFSCTGKVKHITSQHRMRLLFQEWSMAILDSYFTADQ